MFRKIIKVKCTLLHVIVLIFERVLDTKNYMEKYFVIYPSPQI